MSAAIRVTVGNRRKFRNQTSENIDRWKSRGGKRQRREKKEERRSANRKSQKKAHFKIF